MPRRNRCCGARGAVRSGPSSCSAVSSMRVTREEPALGLVLALALEIECELELEEAWARAAMVGGSERGGEGGGQQEVKRKRRDAVSCEWALLGKGGAHDSREEG